MVVETCNAAGDVFWWLTVQPSIMSWPSTADALASSAESSPLEPVTTWKVQCSSQLRWTVQQGRYRDCCIMHCTPCNHWVVRLLGCTHAHMHMHLPTIKRRTSRHADSNMRGVYCLLPCSLEFTAAMHNETKGKQNWTACERQPPHYATQATSQCACSCCSNFMLAGTRCCWHAH